MNYFTLDFSTKLVVMTITDTSCSQTICQKSLSEAKLGPVYKMIETYLFSKSESKEISYTFQWGFPEKKTVTPCWGYQWKIQVGRVKVVGIPGGYA